MAEGCRDGCDPDTAREWRKESREWSRETRQIFLTRRHALRDVEPSDPGDPHAELARIHERERRERERRNAAATTTTGETTP
jgi:hypothetical protein